MSVVDCGDFLETQGSVSECSPHARVVLAQILMWIHGLLQLSKDMYVHVYINMHLHVQQPPPESLPFSDRVCSDCLRWDSMKEL